MSSLLLDGLGADGFAFRAVSWLDQNVELATAFAGPVFDDAGLQAFAEYTILAGVLADACGATDPDISDIAERWLARARAEVARDEYTEMVRRRPLQAFMFVQPYLVLRRRGVRSARMEDQVDWLLSRGLVDAAESTPFRQLDLAYFLGAAGVGGRSPDLDSLAAATFAARAPGPEYIDAATAYSVTHTVLYLSDFGRKCPVPGPIAADRLVDLIDAITVEFWRRENWDLLAEALVARICLLPFVELPPWLDQAAGRLIAEQLPDGSIPGHTAPPEPLTAHVEQEDEGNGFSARYHTTLVLALLGAVTRFASGRR